MEIILSKIFFHETTLLLIIVGKDLDIGYTASKKSYSASS